MEKNIFYEAKKLKLLIKLSGLRLLMSIQKWEVMRKVELLRSQAPANYESFQ